MVKLGDAVLFLSGDDKNLRGSLKGAEGLVHSSLGKLGGVMQGAFSFAVGGLITRGIDAITGSVGGLVNGMIKGNSEFEQYKTQFQVLLGSADAAQKRMEALAKFGATTPFDLPQVVEADRIIQGFGLHSEEAAQKFGYSGEEILKIAGDVASGTGTDFSQMALLLGKFSSGATGEALASMAELGIGTREDLAKMGIEFSKSGQLMSPLPQAMNAVLTLMKKKYGGLMDAQSKTFEGMMSNLRDWTGNALRVIGKPIFEVLKTKLQGLLDFLNRPEIQGALTRFAELIANVLGDALERLPSLLGSTGNAFSSLMAFVGPLTQLFMDNWPTIMRVIQESFTALVTFVQPLVQMFLSNWPAIVAIIQGTFTSLMAFAEPLLKLFIDNWPMIASIISQAVAVIVGVIQSLLLPAFSLVMEAVGAIMTWVNSNMPLIRDTVATILQAISGFWQAHGETIMGIVNNTFTAVRVIIETVMNVIGGIIKAVMQMITGDWNGAWGTLGKVVIDLFSGMVKLIELSLNNVLAMLTGILPAMVRAGAAIASGILDGLKQSWESLTSWLTGALQGLRNLLPFSEPKDPNSPLRGLAESGRSIIGQIQSGIDGMSLNVNPLPMPAMAGAGIGGASTFNINVNAPGGNPEAVARATQDGVLRALRSRGRR